MPWIKIHTEILDDPKLGRLGAGDKWRFVALCVLAGECDAEGYLIDGTAALSVADIAWRLREDAEVLTATMALLEELGLLTQDGGAWIVTNFAKWNPRPQSEKREAWRERKRRQRAHDRDKEQELTGSHDGQEESVTRDTSGTHAGLPAPDPDPDPDPEEEEESDQTTDARASPRGVVAGADPALALSVLLSAGVDDPVARALARASPLSYVEGWVQHATTSRGVKNPAGLIVSRLQAGIPPPEPGAAVGAEAWATLPAGDGRRF